MDLNKFRVSDWFISDWSFQALPVHRVFAVHKLVVVPCPRALTRGFNTWINYLHRELFSSHYARTMALLSILTTLASVSFAAAEFSWVPTQFVAADPDVLSVSKNSGTDASKWGIWRKDAGM